MLIQAISHSKFHVIIFKTLLNNNKQFDSPKILPSACKCAKAQLFSIAIDLSYEIRIENACMYRTTK
jgi:hypothetical protein